MFHAWRGFWIWIHNDPKDKTFPLSQVPFPKRMLPLRYTFRENTIHHVPSCRNEISYNCLGENKFIKSCRQLTELLAKLANRLGLSAGPSKMTSTPHGVGQPRSCSIPLPRNYGVREVVIASASNDKVSITLMEQRGHLDNAGPRILHPCLARETMVSYLDFLPI